MKFCSLFTLYRFPVTSQKGNIISIMMNGITVGVNGINNFAYKTTNQLYTK